MAYGYASKCFDVFPHNFMLFDQHFVTKYDKPPTDIWLWLWRIAQYLM